MFWLLGWQAGAQQKIQPQVCYTLTEQNGLTDNEATCFYKDSRGIMWIGTEYGLNSFDGSSVTQYHGSGLASNVIRNIREDSKGRLWMATNNGLCSYDLQHHYFKSYLLPASFPGNARFLEDICVSGGIIYTAGEAGLVSYDPANDKYSLFPIKLSGNGKEAHIGAMSVIPGSDNDLWLGTYHGLWHFNISTKQLEYVHQPEDPAFSDLVTALYIDHIGTLWMGTWNSGLRSIEPAHKKITSYPNVPANIRRIVEQKMPDGSYKLWLTADLTEYDQKSGAFKPRIKDLLPGYAGSISVNRLYAAGDGLLWIATERGVFIYDASKQYFTHYLPVNKKMSSQGISYCATREGLYIGASDGISLGLYDSSLNRLKDLSPMINDSWPGTKGQAVLGIQERNDTLFLGTNNGLLLYNKTTGKCSRYIPGNNGQVKEFISAVSLSSSGDVYFPSWRNGFWKLDITSMSVTAMDTTGNYAQVKEDSRGNIWLADMTQGLMNYDRGEKKVRKVAISGLPGSYVLTNLVYKNDTIWGANETAVFAVDTRTMASKAWPVPPGMDKKRSDFVMDNAGNIWIASKAGLIAFSTQRKSFVKYLEGDGLLSNDMNGSLGLMPGGNIIYGTENYFTVFDPCILMKEEAPAPLYLEEIRINGKPVISDNELQLKYSDKNISFTWALLHYDKPFQTRYYCKLEGVDEQWRDVGTVGYIQYNSLQPGSYTFSYKAVSPGGIVSRTGSLLMSISPPFWKRWWFILLVACIAIAIIYAIYRYRLEQALKLERLRMKISTDLHDDIGSTLSSISILSDIAMREPDKQQAEDMLHEIKENSINLMDKMDDIVWSINPRHDSLEQLLLRMKRLASKVFEAKKINYAIGIHDSVKEVRLPMQYRQHIYLVIKEAINNIVKHSDASRAVIDVNYKKNLLEVVIRDNGKGFDTAAYDAGNGLMSMRERAKMLNTALELESGNGSGTTIVLRVRIG